VLAVWADAPAANGSNATGARAAPCAGANCSAGNATGGAFLAQYLYLGVLMPAAAPGQERSDNPAALYFGANASLSANFSCNVGWGSGAVRLGALATPSPSGSPGRSASPSSSRIYLGSRSPSTSAAPTPFPACVNVTEPSPSSSPSSSASPSPSMNANPVWVQTRIKPLFVNVSGAQAGMSDAKAAFLRDVLLPDAAWRWGTMLRTIPVAGPLFAARECAAWWTTTAPASCAQFAPATTCGGGGGATTEADDDLAVEIPEEYFMAQTTFTLLDPEANASDASFGRLTPSGQLPAGAGLPAADFALFVTTQHVPSRCAPPGAASGTLAYASTWRVTGAPRTSRRRRRPPRPSRPAPSDLARPLLPRPATPPPRRPAAPRPSPAAPSPPRPAASATSSTARRGAG
jgi:hypothetical protein